MHRGQLKIMGKKNQVNDNAVFLRVGNLTSRGRIHWGGGREFDNKEMLK